MITRLGTFAFVLTAALSSPTSSAPTPVRPVSPLATPLGLALATERVVIFKDGYGLFVKSAAGVADSEGRVHTEKVPGAAVLGTFWAIPEGRALKSTIAEWHETVRPRTDEGSCLSTLELLRANEGKQITFGLSEGPLQGKVLDVLEAPAVRPRHPEEFEGTSEFELPPRGGELVAIELSDKTRQVIPISSVRTLAGKELSTHCLRPGEVATRSKRLVFDFGKEAANKPVSLKLIYFTPGVRWIPTYRINTGGDAKAEVELQGEILNEEEDFENAALDLVVGVPSFKFKGTVSPMSLERTLRSALQQAMPSLMNNAFGMSNANFNNRAGERFGTDESSPGDVMSLASELGAEKRQDLFVYGVKSLGLKKGARAMVSLWKNKVPQRHVYTADFGEATRTASNSGPLKLETNTVWHQLELTDDTDVPFTTGAALLMEGGLPLGQDLLAYTSPGGKTTIPITTALNLRAIQSEREVGRTDDAKEVGNSKYSLLRKKGTIALANHQKERVTMRVTLSTLGKIEKASHSGTVVLDEYDRVNNQSRVSWELTLSPGQTLDLNYELSVYR